MIGILLLSIVPDAQIRSARVERALTFMAYPKCLYGHSTLYGQNARDIAGLPKAKAERPVFVRHRLKSCEEARAKAYSAMVESEMASPGPGKDRATAEAYAEQSIAGFEQAFEANALHPETMVARKRAFERCLKERNGADC